VGLVEAATNRSNGAPEEARPDGRQTLDDLPPCGLIGCRLGLFVVLSRREWTHHRNERQEPGGRSDGDTDPSAARRIRPPTADAMRTSEHDGIGQMIARRRK
jgi:hypothetical protein